MSRRARQHSAENQCRADPAEERILRWPEKYSSADGARAKHTPDFLPGLVRCLGGLAAIEFQLTAGPLLSPFRELMRLNSIAASPPRQRTKTWQESGSVLPWLRQLDEYFSRPSAKILSFAGSARPDFQLKCWRASSTSRTAKLAATGTSLRPSDTRTPFELSACRTIASDRDCSSCHRVIASDGSLCGYGGGLDIKRNYRSGAAHSQPSLRLGIGA